MLRPYQQRAADASIAWMKSSVSPFIVEAVTAAGKSHVIADVAHRIHAMTGKRVLCIAPSAELVAQNRQKYLATGNPASMFSASAGAKDLRHPVVFGSPLTIKNRIGSFRDGYAMVICDEAHGITPTLRGIIDAMRGGNPNLRVMGLTATPYRMGSGYIFRRWPDGRINSDDTARDPYFDQSVDRITGPELIEQGYLTRPVIGGTNAGHYDTGGMQVDRKGNFAADDVDRAYHGKGRLTAEIVADVVAQARDRLGVMLFAATIPHAMEVMASLPPQISAVVTGDMAKGKRKDTIAAFKAQRIKYLVSVGTLTTGFDAPHVDLIAILRKTESLGLLQQIIGRGLRLFDGKDDCRVLDYTTNIEDHCPDGDIFAPVISVKGAAESTDGIMAVCESCGHENQFGAHRDTLDYKLDANGYCLDLDGNRIETEYGPLPGHYGRRCLNYIPGGPRKELQRCEYRWTSKPCPECEAPNDIAARYCSACKSELVDPNEKLSREFKAFKSDPGNRQTDEVLDVLFRRGVSQRGAPTVRADWRTPYRQFSTWHLPDATHDKGMREWALFAAATNGGCDAPKTITYRKEQNGFYRVMAYNMEADRAPE